jgi:pimeloyl-ACP methyl ester carboxylesterase
LIFPAPSGSVALGDGRQLAYDDVGDAGGFPVVYLHGCPDSRLTRHPDDAVAARAGVRLVAVDRPGYGASDPPADSSRLTMARDVVALIDALGLAPCAVLGWSSGGPIALACAFVAPDKVDAVGVVAAPLPTPTDEGVDDVVEAMLPYVVPEGLTRELALEHIREGKSREYLDDLDSVPGLADQLATGMLGAAARGNTGAAFDVRNLMTPWEFALADIAPPVRLWYGSRDDVAGVAAGEQLAADLPTATLDVVDGASHLLLLTHWTEILESLRKEPSCP